MAGLETQHKIVESIEIKGHKDVQAGFNRLAGSSDKVAKSLGHSAKNAEKLSLGFDKSSKAAKKVGKATQGAGAKTTSGFGKAGGMIAKFAGSMLGAITIAGLLEKALSFVIAKIGQFIRHGWEINKAYEAAGSRIQGLALGLIDFGKNATGADKVAKSTRLANIVMAEFRDIGMETATQIPMLEATYARLNSVLAGTGATQRQILDYTKKTAGAAKVYGENAEVAGGIISKAIFEGTVEGESAFAKAFKAQAGVTSKMNLEERIQRVNKTLAKMSDAVGIVTQDTQGALDRWKILSDDILQRVMLPVYKKIGELVAGMVVYLEDNRAVIDTIVTEAQEWWATIWDVSKAIWDVTIGALKIVAAANQWGEKFKLVWHVVKLIRQTFSVIGMGLQLAVEQVRVLIDPNRGMGKMSALSEAISMKWKEIAIQIVKVFKALAKMAIPSFAQKIPGVKRFFKGLDDTVSEMETYNKQSAKRLRAMEKNLGEGPLTETTRAMAKAEAGIGLDKAARDAVLKGMKGAKIKVTQNIAKIEIHQDFRDQDPDRVLVEFITDLERLGEAALQSTVAGEATAFEVGSSY